MLMLAVVSLLRLRAEQVSDIVVNDCRIQALSSTLIRIEPKGPFGYENRTTFNVVDRSFPGVSFSITNTSAAGSWLASPYYQVFVGQGGKLEVTDTEGIELWSQERWPSENDKENLLHWPSPPGSDHISAAYSFTDSPRFFVPEWGPVPKPDSATVDPALVSTNGYDFRNDPSAGYDTYIFLLGDDLSSWHAARAEFLTLTGPTPLLPDWAYGTWFTYWHPYTETEAKSDVERWGSDKLPIDVWGLDMNWRNTSDNQDHFYNHPNNLLFPDYSEWFAYLKRKKLRTFFNDHPYPVGMQTSPEEVKFRWEGLSYWLENGLDFWWYDRNWKFSIPPPQVELATLPLKGSCLYEQTFDINACPKGKWEQMANTAWGSHLYHRSVSAYYNGSSDATISLTKFALPDWRPGEDPKKARDVPADHRFPVWWTGDDVPLGASVESMVDSGVHGLKPFVHSDCGGDVRHARSGGPLVRWVAHCALGTITRLHGADHRPWSHGSASEDAIRQFLRMRYSLMPSLLAAGWQATLTGFPLVARADLFDWPQHDQHEEPFSTTAPSVTAAAPVPDASSNLQYLFLNDTLVAPITNIEQNISTRQVWLPPGQWQDAWTGATVSGPKVVSATQPFERIPMWHRRGGMVVTTASPGLRVQGQDWSTLVVDVFPPTAIRARAASNVSDEVRYVYPRVTANTRARSHAAAVATATAITMSVSPNTTMTTTAMRISVRVSPPEAADANIEVDCTREWVVRLHLSPTQRVLRAFMDGKQMELGSNEYKQIAPRNSQGANSHFPFSGPGSSPAPLAGTIVEMHLSHTAGTRDLSVAVL